jgi:hypothetical protein
MKIEGYFANIKTGNEAVSKLKEAGFKKAVVDINDHYIDDRNVETNLAGTEMSTSLSGLVLESDSGGIGKGKSPLNAASPMVSGMAGFEEIADVNCKVIVEADDSNSDQVKKIIRDMGGDLEGPNFKKPRLDNDRDIAVYNAIDEINKDI